MTGFAVFLAPLVPDSEPRGFSFARVVLRECAKESRVRQLWLRMLRFLKRGQTHRDTVMRKHIGSGVRSTLAPPCMARCRMALFSE